MFKSINLISSPYLLWLSKFNVFYVPINRKSHQWWRILPFKLAKGFSFAGRDQVASHLLNSNQLETPRFRIIDVGAGDPYEDNSTVLFQTEGNAEITSIDIHERHISKYALKRTGKFIHAGIGRGEDRFSIQTTWTSEDRVERELTEIEVLLGVDKRPNQEGRDSVHIKPLDKLVAPGKYDLMLFRNLGYEELALEGIDFEKFEFRYVFVENNSAFRPKSVIREHMSKAGYELCGRIIGFDDVFRKI